MRIGIDVGGTHTDVVLMDGETVLISHKALTSSDIISGIESALAFLACEGADMAAVQAVMIGTTQFTNAVIERRNLTPTAAIRLGLPSGRGMPPKLGWPEDLSAALGDSVYQLHGGCLYDGQPLAEIDDAEIDAVIEEVQSKCVRTAAITSAFSTMNAAHESYVADRLKEKIPDIRLTQSHRIGRIGLLERENAALLNAALLRFADKVVKAFDEVASRFKLNCPVYVSQNDGTLMQSAFVREFPALTFSSGPTNSLRGAARLTGLKDAVVIDIGGTTSDIGVLKGGFPRESNMVVEVGGVRTNFRMPDVQAIGLGGGSIVKDEGKMIGPQSVGHDLVSRALVFGGDTLTATDIIVAAGRAHIGDPRRVSHLSEQVVENALMTMREILQTGLRTVKTSEDPVPVILVGGGAILAPDKLEGASDIYLPINRGVANAIGASIALIGGEAERFLNYKEVKRDHALQEVTEDAKTVAVSAGADPASIRVTDIEETVIPYMDDGATRVRVKVVGDVAALSRADGAST